MARLEIGTFGDLTLKLNSDPVAGLVSRKADALVVYLARAGKPVARETLAGLLWDDSSQSAALTNLRVVLASLKRVLGDYVEATRESIELTGDHWLDAAELELGLARLGGESGRGRASQSNPLTRAAATQLAAALDLYRGDFLQGFFLREASGFEEWVLLERERFRQQVIEALHHLVEFYVGCGEYRSGLTWARRLLELDPLRESAHRQVMVLLARDGQLTSALAHYESCGRLLEKELGVQPEAETQDLYRHLKDSTSAYRHNLPTFLTPFVGREAELTQVGDLLTQSTSRLISIVGPGGLGKTRLAIQVAADKIGAFLNGVCFVPLAALSPDSDAQAVISEIAESLQLTFTGSAKLKTQLFNYLRDKELLLVVDNFEQVVETSALIGELLVACPKVQVLITSRVRLNISGEWVINLDGLTVPEPVSADEAAQGSAVQLFVQTANRMTPHFALTPTTLPAVIRICQLVGGLPLAIELAAAWTRALSVNEIAERIDHDLDFLAAAQRDLPARQRSVRVVFDDAWSQLSLVDQLVFNRLSVFQGGFTSQALQPVAGATPDSLLRLIDASLVRQVVGERYQVHPLLQQFAAAKLAEQSEILAGTQRQHALYFAHLLTTLESHLKGPQQIAALHTIAHEIENVRAAWRWALAQPSQTETARWIVAQLLESLAMFYYIRGWYQVGVDLLSQTVQWIKTDSDTPDEVLLARLLERQATCSLFTDSSDLTPALFKMSLEIFQRQAVTNYVPRVWHGLGYLAFVRGDYAEAEEHFLHSQASARAIGDNAQLGATLSILAEVADRQGQLDRAQQLDEENLALQRTMGEPRSLARALNAVSISRMRAELYAEAELLMTEAAEIGTQLNDRYLLAVIYANRSFNSFSAGDLILAEQYGWESYRLCEECADYWGQALALNNLGEFAHARREYAQAKQLYQQGIGLYRRNDMKTGLPQILADLGLACLELNELAEAKRHLQEAIQLSEEMTTTPMTLKALGGWARMLELESQFESAWLLANVVADHPASEPDARSYAREVQLRLESKLPPKQMAAVRERMKAQTLETVLVGVVS